LPVGLQIASRGKDEAMALRIGMAFEAFLGGIGHPDL
jgi:Asp-tRNA(Asn)/Glu-tRNA(Gln) amidotransferase A subunit family amidase